MMKKVLLICSFLLLNYTAVHSIDNEIVIQDFSCGKVDVLDSSQIGTGCAQDLQNVDLWSGKIQPRRGTVKQNSSAINGQTGKVQLIGQYTIGDTDYLMAGIDGTLYSSTDGGAIFTIIASSYGFTSASRYFGVPAFGSFFIVDGSTHMVRITNTNIVQITDAPLGNRIAFYAERIWTAGVTNSDSILYASRFQDPTDWTIVDTDDGEALTQFVAENDGDSISALHTYTDSLLVFKDHSLWRNTVLLDGLTFVFSAVLQTRGTLYQHSVKTVDNAVHFLASDGFYRYNGVEIINISKPINDTFFDIGQLVRNEDLWLTTSGADFSSGTFIIAQLSTTSVTNSLAFTTHTIIDDFSDGDFTLNPVWHDEDIFGSDARDSLSIVSDHVFYSNSLVTSTVTFAFVSTGTVLQSRSRSEGEYEWTIVGFTNNDAGSSLTCSGNPASHDQTHGLGISLAKSSATYLGSTGLSNFANVPTVGFNTGLAGSQGDALTVQFCGTYAFLWLNNSAISGWNLGRSAVTADGGDNDFRTIKLVLRNDLATGGDDVVIGLFVDGVLQDTFDSDYTFGVGTQLTNAATPWLAEGIFLRGGTSQTFMRFDDYSYRFVRSFYNSEPHDMGSAAASWSTFGVNDTVVLSSDAYTSTQADITYSIYSDSNGVVDVLDSLTFNSSQTITTGQTPTIPFEQFVVVSASFTSFGSEDTIQLDDFTVRWISGGGALSPVAIEHEGEYICAVAIDSTTVNDTMLVYDRTGKWTEYKDMDAFSMTTYRNKPYYGSNVGDSNVFRFQVNDIYADDGVGINSFWESKDFDFGFPATNKTIVRYYLVTDREVGASIVFSYSVNRSTITTSETLILDEQDNIFIKVVKPQDLNFKKGIYHRVKITGDTTGKFYKFLSLSLVPRLETAP